MDLATINWTEILQTMGVAGVLVWYLYYQTSVAAPKRDQIYSDTLKDISKGFTESLKEEREFRKAEMSEMRATLDRSRCLLTLTDAEKLRRNGAGS